MAQQQFMLEVTADKAQQNVVGADHYVGGRFFQPGTRTVLGTWASITVSVDTVTNSNNQALPGGNTGMLTLQLFFAHNIHGHGGAGAGGGGGVHPARAIETIVMQGAPTLQVPGNQPPTVAQPGTIMEAIGSVTAASQQFAATRDQLFRLAGTKNANEFELIIG